MTLPQAQPWTASGDVPPPVHLSDPLQAGTVVHFADKPRCRRRYIIVSQNRFGRVLLAALSGGMYGCQPSSIDPAILQPDWDQSPIAQGKEAEYLRRRFAEGRAMAAGWGDPVCRLSTI